MRAIATSFLVLLYFFSFSQITEIQGSDIYITAPISVNKRVVEQASIWDVTLKSFTPSENKSMLSREELSKLKEEARNKNITSSVNRGFVEVPRIFQNFEGNRGTGGVPPDNTNAISDNGFLVTSINSNIIFSRADGQTTYNAGLNDFFKDLNLGGSFFDPKILFDPIEKKFIVVALSGSKANVSFIAVAFSKTEDPSMDWNFYKLKGDILGEGVWFDYPNIGLTKDDFFICGNMFTDENAFRYSSIYQMNKIKGFNGEEMETKHYTKMKAPSTNQNLFNMTPVNSGWSDNASVMRFLTNDNRGGNVLLYTEVTGNLASNPSFKVVKTAFGKQYDVPQDAKMKNSIDLLETFDCRIMSAIELNNIVHYVFKITTNNLAGIRYGRYNPDVNKIYESDYFENKNYVSYPSVVAFGESEEDSEVILNFLRSSEEIFPEQAGVVCSGTENNFEYSEPMVLKKGDTFVAALEGTTERWGDYTSSSRRFSNNKPEVWLFGCFGRSRFGSWNVQLIKQSDAYNDFFANETVINPGDTISFKTFGTDTLSIVDYKLEHGVKLDSFSKDFSARYDSLGRYDVQLSAINSKGDTISIFKKDFINVIPVVIAPEADFTASSTNIFEGDTVSFSDLSTNGPTKWKWTFSGGTPTSSEEQNPKIVYKKKGSYATVLVSKNKAGENALVKQKYINVAVKPLAPVADFSVDKLLLNSGDSILLKDLSSNNPTSWEWIIKGGFILDSITSTFQNPTVKLVNEGRYTISLTSKNDVGENTVVKKDAVEVGSVSTNDLFLGKSVLYPNPVNSDRIFLDFEISRPSILNFAIYDCKGGMIKELANRSVKEGRMEFSFKVDALVSGDYFLLVRDPHSKFSKSYPFLVVK